MIKVEKIFFGKHEEKEIYKYGLKNGNGFQVNILNLGGIITEIYVNDKNGESKNVVLGYDSLEKYIDNPAYPGAVIGRTAGRIKNGCFSVDGTVYNLYKNNGQNSLHGGSRGLNSKIFDVRELCDGIELFYESPHLEEGYPGNVNFKICYTVSEDNCLTVTYEAESDRKTYVNLTNHTYFNLSGEISENGDEQILKIDSDKVCELGEGLIPTGLFINVENTAFDFRKALSIKEGMEKGHSQFDITRAYDHPFVLNSNKIGKIPQVTLYSNYSGINMEVYTTENTAVIYTGNYLDEVPVFYSKRGNLEKNKRYMGVTVETQDYPNGINEGNFGVKLLEKGEKYIQKTIFKFY